MDLYEAMSTLRAVRRLRPDPVPEDALARILQAAVWAPTGGNMQPYRLLVVRDPERKQAMQRWYAEEWTKYCATHRAAWARAPEEQQRKFNRTLAAGDYLAAHWAEVPVLLVFCFNPKLMAITDAEQPRPSVVGGASVYPAVQNALLAARAEGLGCVLTTLLCLREPEVRELLEIPDGWWTCAHVPIGWPVGGGHGPISRRPLDQVVYDGAWGEGYNVP